MDRRPALFQAVTPVLIAPKRARVAGVPILVLNKDDLPLVALSIVVEAGVADEPAPGVACATAEMLDEGAGGRDAIALAAAFAQLGTRPEIDCGWDYTTVFVQVLRHQLQAALPLIFDLVRRPSLRREDLQRRLAQLGARALARRSDPERVAMLALRRALYPNHPYGRPPLALPGQLKRIRRRQVVAFHRRYYRRPRVAVIVAGDVRLDQAVDWLRPHLVGWPTGAPAHRLSATTGAIEHQRPRRVSPGVELVLVDRPGAAQSVVRAGAVGAAVSRAKVAPLRLINAALGGSFTSRLNQKLREERAVTYGAFSALWFGREGGLSWAGASVETSKTLQATEQILEQFADVAARGLTAVELGKARHLVCATLAEQQETVESLDQEAAQIVALDLPLDNTARLVRRAELATVEELQQVARKSSFLRPQTLVIVGDLKRVGGALSKRFGHAVRADSDGIPIRRTDRDEAE